MICVVGSGGNGQTYFMNFLRDNGININDIKDRDKLKHLSSPNKLKPTMAKNAVFNGVKVKKCIFLYNHPYHSLVSHYRRNWQYKQFRKLGNPKSLTKESFIDFNYIKHATLKNNKDIYGFAYQFKNWISETPQNNLDILFLDFNDVLNEKDRLNAFVGKELNFAAFTVKERNSSTIHHKELYKIYNKLYISMKTRVNKRVIRDKLKQSDPEKYKALIKKVRSNKTGAKVGCNGKASCGKKKTGTTCSIKKSTCSKKNCCSR
jgi:hypothetical protein